MPSFWQNVEIPSGCWIWKGYVSPDGYGLIGGNTAHRKAYEIMNGPAEDDLQLDHLCRVRNCVNPFHLEPVTQAENANRTKKDFCNRGHRLIAANLYLRKDGSRECAKCSKIRQHAAYQLKKAGRAA